MRSQIGDSLILPEPVVMDLDHLISEALMNNPEILGSELKMDVMEARVPQAGALDDPQLQYMREGMPGFRINHPMYDRLELMQMIRFPTKLSTQRKLAEVRAEHAHHDHLEKAIEIIARVKSTYFELWFTQQNIALNAQNVRLMKQFTELARTRYSVGQVSQQDVLKAQVELAMVGNEAIVLRQQELSAKAMLRASLSRQGNDTLGYAVIPEEVVFNASLDSLKDRALSIRPMLRHDSLSIVESETEYSLAKQEYIPDITLGLERLTSPLDGFSGWSVRAGISIPFAPWTLGKAGARTEEAKASIKQMTASYNASRAMVLSDISDLYYKADAAKRQLDNYRLLVLPQAQQSLNASRMAYQTGQTDLLMLIDAYRTNVNLTKEYFMTRMQFEQAVALLERAVGSQSLLLSQE